MISDPAVASDQRYPMLCVVPLTRTAVAGVLYPAIRPGASGLREVSYALVDQLRSIDKRRVLASAGRLGSSDLEAIEVGLRLFLGL